MAIEFDDIPEPADYVGCARDCLIQLGCVALMIAALVLVVVCVLYLARGTR